MTPRLSCAVFLVLASTIFAFLTPGGEAFDADLSDSQDVFHTRRSLEMFPRSGADYRMATVSNGNAKSLKGQATSDPACCTAGIHMTYCFVRWIDGSIYYRRVGSGEVWKPMGGRKIIGNPTCFAHGTYVTAVAVLETIKDVSYLSSCTITNGKLDIWRLTGGYYAREAPECMTTGTEARCMMRGDSGCHSYGLHATGLHWKPVFSSKGGWYGPISTWHIAAKGETLYYTYNGSRQLVYLRIVGGKQLGWKWAGGIVTGKLSICSKGFNTVDIFATDPYNNLVWIQRDAVGRHTATNLGGPLLYPPTCVGRLNNINCFAVNNKYELVRRTYNAGKWGGYTVVAAGYIGTPSCHLSVAGVNIISCYARTLKGEIHAFGLIA